MSSSVRAVLLAIGMLTGCVQIQDFDPVGNAVSVRASWTVDGVPPTPESCRRLGADRVRVTFLDGLRPVPHSALYFECRQGVIDTEDNEVVAAGTWYVRLEAIDPGGTVLDLGATQTILVGPDGGVLTDGGTVAQRTIVVSEVDFDSALVNARFNLGGAAPTVESCSARGIHEVGVMIDGDEATFSRAPCLRGVAGRRVSPGAAHEVALIAYALDDAVVWTSTPETFEVLAGDLCELGGRCRRYCEATCEGGEQCVDLRCLLAGETSPRVEVP